MKIFSINFPLLLGICTRRSAEAEGINKEKNRINRLAMPEKWKGHDNNT